MLTCHVLVVGDDASLTNELLRTIRARIAGTVESYLNANPAAWGADLDIQMNLYNSSGTLIASSNPTGSLSASLTANVSAGRYYVSIDGVGEGGPERAAGDVAQAGEDRLEQVAEHLRRAGREARAVVGGEHQQQRLPRRRDAERIEGAVAVLEDINQLEGVI